MKYYRDLKNVVDTSREEGREEGLEKGKVERNIELAQMMKNNGESIDKIILYTNLGTMIK